jgi:glucosylceramidase
MKTNGQMIGGGSLKNDSREVWANYISKWISAYKNQSIPIWALTPQNEPENAAGWEACVYTAEQEADWIGSYLGPIMNSSHPEVMILPFDHNKDHIYNWTKAMYEHPTASKYTSGIAFHWYSGDLFENVAKSHSDYPQAMLLATEATWERYRWAPGVTPETGDWAFGEGYAHDILGDLNAGAVGWTDWNLVLDTTGGPNHLNNNCDAAMYANNTLKELYLHPQYFYIGHFSKYLVPGSKRIKSSVVNSTTYQGPGRGYGVCTKDDGLQATAFERPDGQVAVVVLNCGGDSLNFKLKDGDRAANATIPAHGIQTYMFPRSSSTSSKKNVQEVFI